jgi:hypothetical protein
MEGRTNTSWGGLVVDAAGTKLAYGYGADPRAQTSMAGSMTFDQAEMIAAVIAQLPDVLREGSASAPAARSAASQGGREQ